MFTDLKFYCSLFCNSCNLHSKYFLKTVFSVFLITAIKKYILKLRISTVYNYLSIDWK